MTYRSLPTTLARMRWPSVATIALASIGLVWQLTDPAFPSLAFVPLMLGFALGWFLPAIGPVKPWDDAERWRPAQTFTYRVIALVAMFGLWTVLLLAARYGWDILSLRAALIAFAFYLITWHAAGPTLYASWRGEGR